MNLLELYQVEQDLHPLSSSFVLYHKTIRKRYVPVKELRAGFLKLVDKHDYATKDTERLIEWLLIETNA